jgi:hypothetical protein
VAKEAGWRPLAAYWLRQAVRFYEKARRRPDGDLLKEAMRESWELAARGTQRCWVAHLSVCLSDAGHTLAWGEEGEEAVNINSLLEGTTAEWLASKSSPPLLQQLPMGTDPHDTDLVRSLPDTCSDGYKTLTYMRWMADATGPPAMLHSGLNGFARITTLARFRMGLHELQIERGRHMCQARSRRYCHHCNTREDEAHMIFECPLYDSARITAHALFADIPEPGSAHGGGMDERMNKFMNPRQDLLIPNFWHTLATFLVTCLKARDISLEEVEKMVD